VKSERGRETGSSCVAPRNHDDSFVTQDESSDSAGLVGSKSSNDLEQVLRTLATASYSLDEWLSTAARYPVLPNRIDTFLSRLTVRSTRPILARETCFGEGER
jgi:hypothetical protein